MFYKWIKKSIPYLSREQRKGIISLIVVLVVLQIGYYSFLQLYFGRKLTNPAESIWGKQQLILDSISLEENKLSKLISPFNPNFITDYKGFSLGMNLKEIDRLHRFRETNQYVNSKEEFQQITGVSNEWMDSIGRYFKFPDWGLNKRVFKSNYSKSPNKTVVSDLLLQDLNSIDQEGLMKTKGIGAVLSLRIVEERARLGGFVSVDQLDFIWGLDSLRLIELKRTLAVLKIPVIKKININTASVNELSKLPYLSFNQARAIVIYRSENGDILDLEDLKKIKKFPLDKLSIISLYLDF